MKRLRSFLAGFSFLIVGAFAGGALAVSAGVPYFTGPQDPASLFYYLNTLINTMNSEINGYIFFASGNAAEASGELNFTTAASFAANGTAATTMTSLGPQGAHTTVQEWLVIVNNNGFIRFAPLY